MIGEEKKVNELEQKYKKLVMLAGFASISTASTLIILKFAIWMFSSSSTLLASLTDSLVDLGASFVNLLALRFALAPPDSEHRFGHYKAESLASLAQAAFIGGSAVLLVVHGIERLLNPQQVAYIDIAIYVSIAATLITVLLVLFQGYVYKKTKSQAIGADRYHYLSDIVLNIGVVIALVFTSMGYLWADGLFASLLGLYILKGSYHIGHSAVGTLLDKAMDFKDQNKIMQCILEDHKIISLHDLKTRHAGPQVFIQCHLVLDSKISLHEAHEITNEAENRILKLYPEAEITIHMEPDDEATFAQIQFADYLACKVPPEKLRVGN